MKKMILALTILAAVLLLTNCGMRPTSPLGKAAMDGRVAEVQALLDRHINPDELDSEGLTPLMYAARSGQAEVIRLLLRAGANPEIRDRAVNNWTALIHAAHKNQTAAALALLEGGANPNTRRWGGMTALIQAAGGGHAPLVRELLAHGADPRLGHAEGATPLSRAVSGGALSDIDRPLFGHCGVEVVRALLEKDPDLKLPDNFEGRSALWFARFNKCRDVLALLDGGRPRSPSEAH